MQDLVLSLFPGYLVLRQLWNLVVGMGFWRGWLVTCRITLSSGLMIKCDLTSIQLGEYLWRLRCNHNCIVSLFIFGPLNGGGGIQRGIHLTIVIFPMCLLNFPGYNFSLYWWHPCMDVGIPTGVLREEKGDHTDEFVLWVCENEAELAVMSPSKGTLGWLQIYHHEATGLANYVIFLFPHILW